MSNIKKSTIILLFLTFIIYSQCYISFYPDIKHTEMLTKSSYEDIDCPSIADENAKPSWAVSIAGTAQRPSISDLMKIRGYLCAKIVMTTTCSWNLISTNDVIKTSIYTEPDPTECIYEIQNFIKNEIITPFYLEPECSFIKKTTIEKSFYIIFTKEVKYDPYNNQFIDTQFVDNKCDNIPCRSRYHNNLWFPDHKMTDECHIDDVTGEIPIWYSNNNGDISFWSPDVKMGNLRNACVRDFCGHKGVLFESGTWISNIFSYPNINRSIDSLTKLQRCNSSRLIKVSDEIEKIDRRLIIWGDSVDEDRCEEIKYKLMQKRTITRGDLQHLIPKHGGLNKVYFIRNNSLYHTLGNYNQVTLYNSKIIKSIIGETSSGQDINTDLFSQADLEGIRDGPNGLFIINNKLIMLGTHAADDLNFLVSDIHLHMKNLKLTKATESIYHLKINETTSDYLGNVKHKKISISHLDESEGVNSGWTLIKTFWFLWENIWTLLTALLLIFSFLIIFIFFKNTWSCCSNISKLCNYKQNRPSYAPSAPTSEKSYVVYHKTSKK